MFKKWRLWGSCLLLIALIAGAVAWTQSRPSHVQTAPATTNHVAQSSRHTDATTTLAEKPWTKLKQPLKLPILMYHSISTGNQLRVPLQQFDQEMTYLKRHHYRTLTTAEAIRALTTNTVPQKKVVWVTLDDAYRDNLKILPVLRKNRQHVTINAITGFTTKSNHLSLAAMRRMRDTGRVDFASHTVRHLDLTTLSAKQQRAELDDSKTWLDTTFDQDTRLLCYPAGRNNETTRRLAKQTGYTLALTTQEGVAELSQGRYSLKRLRIAPKMSLAAFASVVNVKNR
ncbi:polysaccharide deacetylase family protein [Levilactobacillus enshiensis]|uniref:polysaccharide deacetylase family protein n=1 Tax=Levilactobacillus enshiensis TaxID=2590213 RepID=UPI00117B72A8|nr:polysaccharide deacetylase family protein [Levilactobacillus enshiensis]